MHQSPSTIKWQRLFYNFSSCMIKYKLMCFINKVIEHQRQKLALSIFISHHKKREQHVYCFYAFMLYSGVVLLGKGWGLHFSVLKRKFFSLNQRF